MKIAAISNINFKQNPQIENNPQKEENKSLSIQTKALIGTGIVAAGTLAVYFITHKSKAAKEIVKDIATTKSNGDIVSNKAEPKEIKDITPKEILEKIDEKITKTIEGFKSDFNELSERLITPLENGNTKITYKGTTDDGNKVKEILMFNKNNDLMYQQSESFVLEQVLEKFPIQYKKSTKFTFPDKTTKSTEMTFYTDMTPKKFVSDNKTVIYGYDFNSQPSGAAYTENDKVILKLNDKKFGQVFESFDDLFEKTDKDDFKMR